MFMGYRSNRGGSRRSSGQRFQKSQHEKAKVRGHKHQEKGAYVKEESALTTEMLAEKTLSSLKRLGEQKFAVSPFRQYFDDWLINIEQTLSELQLNPAIKVDQEFVKESEQILAKTEQELAEIKEREKVLEPCVRELADTNHLLLKLDTDYAVNTRELAAQKNVEIQHLTQNVHNLETEVERMKVAKTSLIGGLSKKTKALKVAEMDAKLDSAKTELGKSVDSFKKDQDKLHDNYEKNKASTMEKVKDLEMKIEKLENDNSASARQSSAETLTKAVKALLARQPKPPSEST